jgi:predicted Zn-dependent protease
MSAPKSLRQGVPAGAVLSREQAQAIVERVVGMSKADAINVTLHSNHNSNGRFADNQMSTAGATTDAFLGVQSSYGPKHAVVTTNDLSEASLRRVGEQSEVLAKLAPDDPEAMPEVEPQQYVPVNAYIDATAAIGAGERAQAALTALAPARRAGDIKAAGFLLVGAGCTAQGNSAGLFAYHRSTSTNYTLTVRTTDGTGSGWAAADHPDWRQIDFARVSARAIDKARTSRNPAAVEPGRYTVIFEPQAVGDLAQLIAFYADARQADEGRSPFSKEGGGNKVGEKIVDERVTLFSDPADPQLLAQPFDGEGMRLGRQVWVDNGNLNQ